MSGRRAGAGCRPLHTRRAIADTEVPTFQRCAYWVALNIGVMPGDPAMVGLLADWVSIIKDIDRSPLKAYCAPCF